jgi:acyl carrier protein
MSEDLTRRVIGCIAATQHLPAEAISVDSTFEELGVDSLDGINILFAIENEFEISIPDSAAQQVRSVGEMIAGVERLLQQKAAGAPPLSS